MSASEVIRQHYLPRTYLKHYSTERSGEFFIKAFPSADCREDFRIERFKRLPSEDLYTLPGNTAEERMLIETFYSNNYEVHYNKTYEILIDPNKKNSDKRRKRANHFDCCNYVL